MVHWEGSDNPKLGPMRCQVLGVLQVTSNGMLDRTMFFLTEPPSQHETIVGQIIELLTESEVDGFGIAVIDVFMVAATRHERFGMPYLVRHQTHPSFLVVHSKVLSIPPTHFALILISAA